MINIFQPTLGKKELNELAKVFDSNWIGKGEYVDRFEKLFAKNLKSNSDNFISTTSCTEAIFLAAYTVFWKYSIGKTTKMSANLCKL